jgi:hypothetical protein
MNVPGNVPRHIRRFGIFLMLLSLLFAALTAATVLTDTAKAETVTWPGDDDWELIVDDPIGDTNSEIDVGGFYYFVNTVHIFFRIETLDEWSTSDYSIGVFMDDPDVHINEANNNPYDFAAAAYVNGDDNDYVKIYYWDPDEPWTTSITIGEFTISAEGEGCWVVAETENTDHIRVNYDSFNGVDFCFDKSTLTDIDSNFDTTLTDNIKMLAATSSENVNAMEYLQSGYDDQAYWKNQNPPESWLDDWAIGVSSTDIEGTGTMGFWKRQFMKKEHEIPHSTLIVFLKGSISTSSEYFNFLGSDETVFNAAKDILWYKGTDMRFKARAQLLAAWLNWAAGAVEWDEEIDIGDTYMEVRELFEEAEEIIGDTGLEHEDYEYAKDLAEAVNTHNPRG